MSVEAVQLDATVAARLDGVEKSFGETRALDGISLTAAAGELLCVLGPSGAGKTTLLRSIAGLEQPDAGDIAIGGRDVGGLRPGLRDVAMFFDNLSLYPHKTVRQNLAFPLQRRRIERAEIAARVGEIAALLGIEHTLDRRPATLSGGERQRVALGRVLIRPARLFLLDEPLSNLDALLRLHMRSELKRLQLELGHTTIYATPDPLEALALADRVVVIDRGAIQQVGTPDEIYRAPANRMVATFVGNPPINLIPGHAEPSASGTVVRTEHFALEVAGDRAPAGGGPVLLGVRPEDVRVAGPGADTTAEVFALEPLGAKTVIDLQLGDLLLKALQRGHVELPIGAPVSVEFDPHGVHLIDEQSGRVLYGPDHDEVE